VNFWQSFKDELESKRQRKKDDQEIMDKARFDAEVQRKIIYEEEVRKYTLKLAIDGAKRQAAENSGMKKHQAENRLRNLEKSGGQPAQGFLSKLSEYTTRNMAKTEERKQRQAEKMKNVQGMKNQPVQPLQRKPFSPTFTKL